MSKHDGAKPHPKAKYHHGGTKERRVPRENLFGGKANGKSKDLRGRGKRGIGGVEGIG
jgi:hypothetical protein